MANYAFTIGNWNFVTDNQILWLAVTLVGSPPTWQPGVNYNLGDVVVPISPQPSQANLMFQCVGFLGQSGGSAPSFPSAAGDTVIDNEEIEWLAVDPTQPPPSLPYNEYYLIQPTLTVNPAD